MKVIFQDLLLKLIIVLFAYMVISSCKKDWYDIKSDKGLTVPTTLQDLEYLMNNFELINANTPGLGEIASDGHYIPEERWQTLPNITIVNVQKNAYTWSNTSPYVEVRDWNLCYERVFISNLVLDGLKKIKTTSSDIQQKLDALRGNALFHKAKNYFDLAQIYAQPFDSSTANSDLGLPLRDGIDITEPSVRSTVRQTYDEIIFNLITAKNLLPALPSTPLRASKASIFALLARVYLIMGAYHKAAEYADSSLSIYDKLIDYNSVPETNANMGYLNQETIFFTTMVNWQFTFSTGFIYIDSALYNKYDTNDLRKTRFFRNTSGGIRFKGMYNQNTIPFTGLATDELYLIKSECCARTGNIADAMHYLNALLRTRWNSSVTYKDVTATNLDEALEKILLERKKELLMRGLRWYDLRRLNKDTRFRATLSRSIGGETYTLEPNSFRYTFPIPQDILQFSKLQQNPGW